MSDDEIRAAPRVCFFAHYHPRGVVAEYVLLYLQALRSAGFTVVVLSTAELAEPEQVKLRGAAAALIMRENVGLDFGGWIEAYQRFAPIHAELLLLANDSVYGPVGDLSAFIDRLTQVPADIYGAVESWECAPHLQSWFLLLRPSAYRSVTFRTFMSEPVPSDLTKGEIIQRYEVRLLRDLLREGLRHHSAFSPAAAGEIARQLRYNPTQPLWRALITCFGIPFIKIELLRDNPAHVGGVQGWRRLVRRLSPTLVKAVDADLALRNARPQPSLRARLAFSGGPGHVRYRPELQPLIVLAATARSVWAKRLVLWIFRRVESLGWRIRYRLDRRKGQARRTAR